MRDADTVLAIIRERGKRGLPLRDIYRQLYNPMLYLKAYARLYANEGAMTPGATGETVDGMSREKIERLIGQLRNERYKWTPVRRTYIPKKDGKKRPLGLPTWSDKLVQEVIRLILEAYYESQFSDSSHGFRPERGCHTALTEVATNWTGTRWFIEGDISKCFDEIDHEFLLETLKEKLHDNRFLRLIQNMLKAGYLEDWKWNQTFSGSPQGGVASPILSNIYLDKLDTWIETTLLPQYNQGKRRRKYQPYESLYKKIRRAKKRGDRETIRILRKQRRKLPSRDPNDPAYRRLRYIRYADDFLLGFNGPKREAEEIKHQIGEYMRNIMKLQLSEKKTLVTHATTETAKFLGYEIVNQRADNTLDRHGRRNTNGSIGLRLPLEKLQGKIKLYLKKGRPTRRPELLHDDDYTIVSKYQQEYRGLVQYYLMAQNVCWLGRLRWVMETSLLQTLANKHKTTVGRITKKYKAVTETPYGKMKCLKVVIERGGGKKPLIAQFGGIPLRQKKTAILIDQNPEIHRHSERNELSRRLLTDKCELCGSTQRIEVHHIRKLADLKEPGRREKPHWVKVMAAKRRKTLVVCQNCHQAIHAGKIQTAIRKRISGEPGELKGSSPVRRGADEKVPS
jgi:group II intron reverse transcriptase/maturase